MGYIRVAHREVLRQLDNKLELPKGWDKFVEEQAKYHNLIIKSSKNKCYCTNCNNTFISSKKVNQETKCPYCHNKYLIKRSNLRYHEFKDYLSILDLVNDTFVVRYFELKTSIDAFHKHNSSVVEFAREIPTNNYNRYVFVNDRVSKCQCHIHIYHGNSSYINAQNWREYTRNYSLVDYSIVFPGNMKKLLKDTEYKYSYIWEVAKHSNYINLAKLISEKEYIPKIEQLAKMKLYNLALRVDEFKNYGNFQNTFGVPKDFYPFMKKYNITYLQLKLLQLLKEKDIKKLRYLQKFVTYGDSTYDLEYISNYIRLDRFIKYAKIHHGNVDMSVYKDYLRFAKLLGLDLKNNRYAFPKDLNEEHDKLQDQVQIQETELIQKAIIRRGKKLSANKYQNDKFIIFPAHNLKEMQEESRQQNNCVRTYAEDYADGSCDIYFMRDIGKQDKSLVTVEVRNNRVVQSRTKNNKSTTENQDMFLNEWENKVLKGAA